LKKAARTRQYIIEQTAPVFNQKGFDGTTLQDMVAATGLTKGALYGNFEGKDEIASEAFRYSIAKVRRMVSEKLESVRTCKGQLEALFDFYAEYIFHPPVDGGCPLLNTAVECDDHRPTMRRVVLNELTATVKFIESLLEQGVENGEFHRKTDCRRLAYIFFCSIEGALMFARVERSKEPMEIVVAHCKKILRGITK
jgi:TetR/AcrR family transcriptional regulator, transcriptional repressor for nem operon